MVVTFIIFFIEVHSFYGYTVNTVNFDTEWNIGCIYFLLLSFLMLTRKGNFRAFSPGCGFRVFASNEAEG